MQLKAQIVPALDSRMREDVKQPIPSGTQATKPTQSVKLSGCMGCLTVVVVGGILLAIIGSLAPKSSSPQPSTVAGKTTHAEAPPPQKRDVPRRGDIVVANPSYVPAICIETKDGFTDAIRWINRRDMGEVARIMLRHGGQVITAGEKLKILDPGFMTTAKVRVISTDRECYTIAEVTR